MIKVLGLSRMKDRMRWGTPGRKSVVHRLELFLIWYDIWVGAYIAPDAVYVCPFPMVVFKWYRSLPSRKE